jgi:hypothetical protein
MAAKYGIFGGFVGDFGKGTSRSARREIAILAMLARFGLVPIRAVPADQFLLLV